MRCCVLTACLLVMGIGAAPAYTADHPVDAARLLLKRSRNGTETLLFESGDPTFPFPAIGGPDDPVTGGAGGMTIELFSVASPVGANLVVPGGTGWSSRTAKVDSFKFANRAAPGGTSPVKAIALRQARSVRIVARKTGLPLDAPQQAVGIRITIGSLRACALFGASTVVRDQVGTFDARAATAASLVDCSTVALGGPPPTCGDNEIDQASEVCDGTALGVCADFGWACGAPGGPTTCECCSYTGPHAGEVPCCNPSSIVIPLGPPEGAACIAQRCDPPFSCDAGNQCQADGTCCTTLHGVCILRPIPNPNTYQLNPCCPGLECREPSQFGTACCVSDGGSCASDTDCCSGTCDQATSTCAP